MFFLFFIIFILIVAIAIHTSKIGIEVKNLKIDTQKNIKINEDRQIYLNIYIFWKLKIFKKNLRKAKISNFKMIKNKKLKIDYKQLIKKVKLQIVKINLYIRNWNRRCCTDCNNIRKYFSNNWNNSKKTNI